MVGMLVIVESIRWLESSFSLIRAVVRSNSLFAGE
jgi:hypothetical protein